MRQRILVSALGVGALAVAGLTAQGLTAQGAPTPYTAGKHAAKVCSATKAAHTATCSAEKLVNDKNVSPTSTTPPATGLTPAGLRDAYKLNGLSAGGRTVAIVDAYGYPNLERDLGVYRIPVRPVRLHDGQRLPAHRQPDRRHLAAPVQRRLGR